MFTILIVAVLGLGGLVWRASTSHGSLNSANGTHTAEQFGLLDIPLNQLSQTGQLSLSSTQTLNVNGQLTVNNGFVIAPSDQPTSGVAGEMYYNRNTNQLNYFNGTGFVSLAGNPQTVTSINGVTGNLTLAGGLSLNGTQLRSTGIVNVTSASTNLTIANDGNGTVTITDTSKNSQGQSGTAGHIAVFTGSQTVGDSLLSQSNGTVTVAGAASITGNTTIGGTLNLQQPGTSAINIAESSSGVVGQIYNDGNLHITGGQNNLWLDAGGSGTIFMNAGNNNPVAINEATIPAYPLEVNGDINLTAGHSYRIGGTVICSSSGCSGSGGGGVSSLNGLVGTLTIANASAASSTITINDASTSQKGIAQFNGTNFSASGGIVNTTQDINTAAAPTFGQLTLNSSQASASMLVVNNTDASATGNLIDLKLNGGSKFSVSPTGSLTLTGSVSANTITPTAALTVGATSQSFTLQGNAGSTITSTSGGFATTVGFTGTPTGGVAYNFDSAATPGTYTICTTVGNCAGSGGGVTTPGGTGGKLAKFTAGQTIADSIISDNGTTVTVGGTLSVNAITPTAALTIGATGQNLTLQGAQLGLTSTSGANTTTVNFTTPTANVTYNIPTAATGTYDLCTTAGNCVGTGGGVSTSGGTNGKIVKFTGSQTIGNSIITDNGTSIGIAGNANLSSGSQYQINGAQISSADLSNDANLAKLNGAQTFTGSTNTFRNSLDSSSAFAIQNAASRSLLNVNSTSGAVTFGNITTTVGQGLAASLVLADGTNDGFGTTLNTTTLTASRTITLPNESGTICTTGSICAGYAASSGSGNYVQNQNSTDQTANLRITGTARANTSVLSPTFDTATNTGLFIGNSNATGISLGNTGGNLQTIIYGQTLAKSTAGNNSLTAFQVQNATGTAAVSVDTVNLRLGVGGNVAPAYALDVTGDVNSSTALRIAGTSVCDASGTTGCIAKSGSGYYIHNQTTLQNANMYVQASDTTAPTAVIEQGASGTADIFDLLKNDGSTKYLAVSSTGSLTVANGSSYSIGSTSSGSLTSTGSITITAGGGSTWSSTANLTLQAGSGSTLNIQTGAAGTGTINLGVSNAATINIGNNSNNARTIAIGNTGGSAAQTITLGNTGGTSSTTIQGGTGSTAINLTPGTNGSINATATGTGNINLVSAAQTVVKSSTNNTTAFQVQNAAGGYLVNVDTSGNTIGLIYGMLGVTGGTGFSIDTYFGGTPITIGASASNSVSIGNNSAAVNLIGNAIVAKTGTNGTSAFQIQNASAVAVLDADTTNGRVGIGTTAPGAQLDVVGQVPITTAASVFSSSSIVYDVATSGKYAYTANFGSIQTWDITRPTAPASLGSVSITTGISGLKVSGNYLFAWNSTWNLVYVIDVSNPKSPTILKSLTVNTPDDIAVQGRYIYIATDDSNGDMITYDVSNPANPTLVSTFSQSPRFGNKIAVQGNYAYLAESNGLTNYLQIIDISNPASPVNKGLLTTSASSAISVVGRYVFMGGGTVLQAVDASDPTTPVSASTVTADGSPADLTIQGRYAYVAINTAHEVQVFNVSNPASMSLVGTISTGGEVRSIAAEGRYAYVGDYTNGKLLVYDMGGGYVQQLESGDLSTGALDVSQTLRVAGTTDLANGLRVNGSAGITGDLSVRGSQFIQTTTNSATAFNIQDSSNASALTVDTTNDSVSVKHLGIGAVDATYALTIQSSSNTAKIYRTSSTTTDDLLELYSDVGSTNNLKFKVNANGDIFTDGSTTIGAPADLAENYPTAEPVEAGDVVIFKNGMELGKTTTPYDSRLAGVVSTAPGVVLSGNTNGAPLALKGRVPVKVTTENGPITAGDLLTASATMPGYAMKATGAGIVIGTALDSLGSGTGTVQVFVNVGYNNPGDNVQGATQFQDVNVQGKLTATNLNVTGSANISNLSVSGSATIANLTVANLTTAELAVNGHIVTGGGTPTVHVDGTLCNGATATIDGTDTAGLLTVTTPAECAGTGNIATITFAKAFGKAPRVTMTAADADASTLKTYVDSGAITPNSFTLATPTTVDASKTYRWYYQVLQ